VIDYARLLVEAQGSPILATLSPESVALFLDTAQWVENRSLWENGDDKVTDSEWDEIEALVAQALTEIMTEATLPVTNPVGTIFPFVTENPPDGALECDGAAYWRVDYPALWDILDPTWKVDSDSFVVPDLRGRVPLGVGQGAGLPTDYAQGDTGGAESHTLTLAETPNHNHAITDHGHFHGYSKPTFQATQVASGTQGRWTASAADTDIATTGIVLASAGGDGAHENRQPYLALRFALWAE
jgi:microcystin-dependent protein